MSIGMSASYAASIGSVLVRDRREPYNPVHHDAQATKEHEAVNPAEVVVQKQTHREQMSRPAAQAFRDAQSAT